MSKDNAWFLYLQWPINLRCSGTASFVINIEGALTQKKEVTTNTTTLVLPYSDHTLTVLTVNSQNVSSNFNKEFLLVHISGYNVNSFNKYLFVNEL